MMNMFGNQMVNSIPSPIAPQSQVVIPQITIPQSLSAQIQTINPYTPVKQYTAKSEAAARSMKFPPNSRIAIFDETAPVFYFREIGENGEDLAFTKCSYVEIEEPAPPEYLTVDQFRTGMAELKKELREELSDGKFVRAQSAKQRNANLSKSNSEQSADSDSK